MGVGSVGPGNLMTTNFHLSISAIFDAILKAKTDILQLTKENKSLGEVFCVRSSEINDSRISFPEMKVISSVRPNYQIIGIGKTLAFLRAHIIVVPKYMQNEQMHYGQFNYY